MSEDNFFSAITGRSALSAKPFCPSCERDGSDIQEYINMAHAEDVEVDDYIRQEEGTFNHANGHFLCTVCYVKAGMPSSPHGWTCP